MPGWYSRVNVRGRLLRRESATRGWGGWVGDEIKASAVNGGSTGSGIGSGILGTGTPRDLSAPSSVALLCDGAGVGQVLLVTKRFEGS